MFPRMSNVLKLKAECSACGSNSDLYGSNCKHITLCFKCGKSMAEKKEKCCFCGTIITRLIREYNVRRASSANDRSYFVGKFSDGHRPDFNNGFKWSLRKDPKHQGMLKKAPLVLEDETGKIKYEGRREEPEFSKYFFLIFQNQEFVAVPADYWVRFNKVPGTSRNQLTIEEAETMMKDRKKFTAECRRRMMRAENSCVTVLSSGRLKKSSSGIDEEDLDDKKIQLVEVEEESIEKGVDWEYEDHFSDDDEQVGTSDSPPASPEVIQGLDFVEDNDEEEGFLSQSGKDMKTLLLAANKKLNESDGMKIDDLVDERKTSVKKEIRISIPKSNRRKNDVRTEITTSTPSATTAKVPVTEEEVRAALLEMGPTTIKELSSRFKTRVVTKQDREAFASILKKIADVHKNIGSKKYIVLKRKRDSL